MNILPGVVASSGISEIVEFFPDVQKDGSAGWFGSGGCVMSVQHLLSGVAGGFKVKINNIVANDAIGFVDLSDRASIFSSPYVSSMRFMIYNQNASVFDISRRGPVALIDNDTYEAPHEYEIRRAADGKYTTYLNGVLLPHADYIIGTDLALCIVGYGLGQAYTDIQIDVGNGYAGGSWDASYTKSMSEV